MSFNKAQLRKLCTAPEFALAQKSLSPELGKLSPTQLVACIKRARALRDKNRDLYKRQTLNKRKPGAAGKAAGLNARTAEKAQAFDQMLKNFEAQLAKTRTAATATPAPQKKAAKKKAAKAKKPAAQTRPAAEAARKKAKAQKLKKKAGKTPAANSAKALAAGEKKAPPAKAGWGGFASKTAQAAGHRAQLQQSRSKPILSHIKSAGKRAQAKRDNRRA